MNRSLKNSLLLIALLCMGLTRTAQAGLEQIGAWGTGPYQDVAVAGNHVYAVACTHLQSIDVSNPVAQAAFIEQAGSKYKGARQFMGM